MADDPWKFWSDEILRRDSEKFVATIEQPKIQNPEHAATMNGFWRLMAARTKTGWPVFIYPAGDVTMIRWGGSKEGKPVDDDFGTNTWMKLAAVREAEWQAAIDTKRWPDGLIAIPETEEERLDIIPSTPASEGGNMSADEVDAYHAQISAKLAALVEKGKTFGPVDSLEKAEAAAKIRDDILALGKMGEERRKAEAKPFDDGKAAVQAKWVPHLKPASEMAIAILDKVEGFKRDEKRRLEREERERIAEETRKRLAAEAEERAKIAAANKQPAPPAPTKEEIDAQAHAAAAEAEVKVEAPRVQGSATARATSKAKVQKGRIVDVDQFIAAIKDQADFREWLQDKANRLARAKTALPGMTIDDN